MNDIEKIEEAIEAKMAEIDGYEGIKRPNSYFMLAQFLKRYAEMCDKCGEDHSKITGREEELYDGLFFARQRKRLKEKDKLININEILKNIK